MTESISLSLLVLRCADLERSCAFYTALGLTLIREQHGNGPVHYSAAVGDAVVELFPKGTKDTSALRFGIRIRIVSDLPDAVAKLGGLVVSCTGQGAVIRDPDGHTIELTFV